jgi:hypothetical protein
MILEFLANMALGLVVFVVSLLPDVEVDVPSIAPAFSMMLAFDALLPIHEALSGVVMVVGLLTAMFVLKVVQTIVAHVPGLGGGGA